MSKLFFAAVLIVFALPAYAQRNIMVIEQKNGTNQVYGARTMSSEEQAQAKWGHRERISEGSSAYQDTKVRKEFEQRRAIEADAAHQQTMARRQDREAKDAAYEAQKAIADKAGQAWVKAKPGSSDEDAAKANWDVQREKLKSQ